MSFPLFTFGELVELKRALQLIMLEDKDCNVNMSSTAVQNKSSAMKKLEQSVPQSNLELAEQNAGTVSVHELRKKKENR